MPRLTQMIPALDASPHCYLLLIDEIDLLPQHFSHVVVAQAVILELRHDDGLIPVRKWASILPIRIAVPLDALSGDLACDPAHQEAW